MSDETPTVTDDTPDWTQFDPYAADPGVPEVPCTNPDPHPPHEWDPDSPKGPTGPRWCPGRSQALATDPLVDVIDDAIRSEDEAIRGIDPAALARLGDALERAGAGRHRQAALRALSEQRRDELVADLTTEMLMDVLFGRPGNYPITPVDARAELRDRGIIVGDDGTVFATGPAVVGDVAEGGLMLCADQDAHPEHDWVDVSSLSRIGYHCPGYDPHPSSFDPADDPGPICSVEPEPAVYDDEKNTADGVDEVLAIDPAPDARPMTFGQIRDQLVASAQDRLSKTTVVGEGDVLIVRGAVPVEYVQALAQIVGGDRLAFVPTELELIVVRR